MRNKTLIAKGLDPNIHIPKPNGYTLPFAVSCDFACRQRKGRQNPRTFRTGKEEKMSCGNLDIKNQLHLYLDNLNKVLGANPDGRRA